MKPYQSSNIVPKSGLLKMTLAALIGGAAVGGITYLIALLFYLIIIFPIGIGSLGGAIGKWAVRSGKVRNPLVASLFGLLTGLTIFGTLRGLEFVESRRQIYQPQAVGNIVAANQTPRSDQKGLGVVRIGRYNIKNMGETGTKIYWLVELAIISYLAISIPRAMAAEAFCESSNDWYHRRTRLGNVNPEERDRFLVLIKIPHLPEAGTLINTHIKKVEAGSLELYTKTVNDSKNQEVLLSINSTVVNKKGQLQIQEIETSILSPTEYQQLQLSIPITSENFTSTEVAYEAHDLDDQQVAAIVQQLPNYTEIQATYLLKIASIKSVPVTNTYQLGVVFDRQQISTSQNKQDFLEELSSEIKIPGEAYVTLLNDDPESLQAIRKIVTQPVYHKQV
jgi:hypothetical protein